MPRVPYLKHNGYGWHSGSKWHPAVFRSIARTLAAMYEAIRTSSVRVPSTTETILREVYTRISTFYYEFLFILTIAIDTLTTGSLKNLEFIIFEYFYRYKL